MEYPYPPFSIHKPCEEAISDLTRRLQELNFQVVRTFDLQEARSPIPGHGQVVCPSHGLEACDCQLVVLLVYAESQVPVSLVVHGQNDRTWFELVDTPEQRAAQVFQEAVRHAYHNRI